MTMGIMALQLFHLFWLTTDVVLYRLIGKSFFELGKHGRILISLIDFLEVPTLITVSLFYIVELKNRFSWKGVVFLLFINIQWLHLFWITDEIIAAQFISNIIIMPIWLSWIGVLIDYLELPIIYDLIKRAFK